MLLYLFIFLLCPMYFCVLSRCFSPPRGIFAILLNLLILFCISTLCIMYFCVLSRYFPPSLLRRILFIFVIICVCLFVFSSPMFSLISMYMIFFHLVAIYLYFLFLFFFLQRGRCNGGRRAMYRALPGISFVRAPPPPYGPADLATVSCHGLDTLGRDPPVLAWAP